MMIIAKKLMGGGKTLIYLFVAVLVIATGSAWAADVDMEGKEESTTNLGGYTYNGTAIKNNTLKNGTLNVTGNQGFGDGTFTFGSGLVLNQTSGQWGISGGRTVKFIDGAKLNYTSTSDIYFGRLASGTTYNGTSQLILDNGIINAKSELSFSPKASSAANNKNVVLNFTMQKSSSLTLPNDKELRFGEVTQADDKKHTTLKVTALISESTIEAKQVRVGKNTSCLTDTNNSYNKLSFGSGAILNIQQIYVYPYPAPSVTFDGATIKYTGTGSNSFLGQNVAVTGGTCFEILSGGLTIEVPSGISLKVDGNASGLKGEGGVTKTGPGSVEWNVCTDRSGGKHQFTGPLVVSEGVWTSSKEYLASVFRADGGKLNLSNAKLSAEKVALAATNGGTLTLSGATITDTAPDLALAGGGTTDYFTRDAAVGTYTLDSLTLGEGAVLDLEADATAIDTIIANTTSITATAENKATININFSALPSPMATFTFFEVDSANKFSVVPKFGSLTLPYETSIVDGKLTLMITADNYTWNGTQTNWGDADAWTKGGAFATWADGNNAVFSKSNTEANIAAKVSAAEVRFAADATVSGSETLSVPSISVEQGVIGTIKAPIAGAFEKVGAGMLTLTKPRTDQTTLSEGTLAMSGESATVDYQKLTLGTDATKNVTFDYGGKTLTADSTVYLGAGMDITLTNGFYTNSKAIEFTNSTIPSILTVAKGATLYTDDRFNWNVSGEATLNIAGGTVKSVKNNNNWIMQGSYTGGFNINVIDGGLLEFGGEVYMLSCRDGNDEYLSPKLNFKAVDSTVRVVNNKSLRLGYDDSTKPSAKPILTLGATNSVFDIAYAIFLGNDKVDLATEGAYTADFENCVITARYFNIYADRPLNAVRFNGTRLVANTSDPILLWTAEAFDTKGEGGTAIKPVTIDEGGLILDTNGKNVQLGADPQGGTLTKDGAGKLTIAKSQTSTGGFVCEEGETVLNAGLTMNRTVSVKNGATFTVKSTKQSSVAGLTLDAGSKLNIESYTSGIVPILATTVTLPAEGSVELSMNGGEFTTGTYTILAMNDIAVKDVDGKLRPSTGNASYTWSVSSDNTLVLTVGNPVHGRWRASAAGGDFSSPGNWEDGVVPTAGTIDFSGVAADMTVDCGDMSEIIFDAVTMGAGVITFTGSFKAKTFSDTSKVAVGVNSMVILDGDLAFSGTGQKFITYKVDNGGAFVVRGMITTSDTADVRPYSQECEGYIVAKGLENLQTNEWRLRLNNGKPAHWVIGGEGLKGDKAGFWSFNEGSSVTTIKADSDFVIDSWVSTGTSSGKGMTIDTTGWSNSSIDYTITAKKCLVGVKPLTVKGGGKFVCDYTLQKANSQNAFSGAISLTDTATLAIKAGKQVTTGAITVNANASFEVAQSGTVEPAGSLTFEDGAILKFNFTKRNEAPILKLTDKPVNFGESKTIKVSLSGVRPSSNFGEPWVLTEGGKFAWEGEDGSLVKVAIGEVVNAPKWLKRVVVNDEGNLCAVINPLGTSIIVK